MPWDNETVGSRILLPVPLMDEAHSTEKPFNVLKKHHSRTELYISGGRNCAKINAIATSPQIVYIAQMASRNS